MMYNTFHNSVRFYLGLGKGSQIFCILKDRIRSTVKPVYNSQIGAAKSVR
jgi:hypothetical protein